MSGKRTSTYSRTGVSCRETADRAAHLERRRSWANDGLREKARAIMAGALFETVQSIRMPCVSVLVATARPERLEGIYETVAKQQSVQTQLVLLTLGFCPSDAELRRLAREHGIQDIVYLYLPADVPLGECYNYCIRSADADVVAIMDDGDHYGPQYLSDQVYSLKYSGADIVSKQAHYMYLEELDATLLRLDGCELSFTDVVSVPTMLGARDLLAANPFQPFGTGEDASVWSPVGMTLKVYSADKFNYFQTRLPVGSIRQLPDTNLLSSGKFQFFGDPAPRIDI